MQRSSPVNMQGQPRTSHESSGLDTALSYLQTPSGPCDCWWAVRCADRELTDACHAPGCGLKPDFPYRAEQGRVGLQAGVDWVAD